MQQLTEEVRGALGAADRMFTRWREPVPVALDALVAPSGPSLFIDVEDHVHMTWSDGKRFAYTRDGVDPLSAVREVARRHLGGARR